MKNIALFSLISTVVITSSIAFADTKPLHQYFSTLHPQAAQSSLLHPPTDISIINASASYIYAVVPNSPVNDYLAPGYNDHIYNYDPNIWTTYVVLQDVYRNTFYSATVCREAILTITGYTGNFRVNMDTDLCN